MPDTPPSLYEWAGGAPALARLTEHFYTQVKADPMLGPVFAQMDARHPRFVALFLGEVFGGPDDYTRERGGHPQMIRQHLEKHLSEPLRRRWVSLLVDSADAVGLPNDPEFRSAFISYIEWGTRLAIINSQPGVTPGADQPMPSWGWGVVGGPYVPK